jgi:hypothetical protein
MTCGNIFYIRNDVPASLIDFSGYEGGLSRSIDFCQTCSLYKCEKRRLEDMAEWNKFESDLTEFANNKAHMLDGSEWFEKHSHLGITSDQPEDEE